MLQNVDFKDWPYLPGKWEPTVENSIVPLDPSKHVQQIVNGTIIFSSPVDSTECGKATNYGTYYPSHGYSGYLEALSYCMLYTGAIRLKIE